MGTARAQPVVNTCHGAAGKIRVALAELQPLCAWHVSASDGEPGVMVTAIAEHVGVSVSAAARQLRKLAASGVALKLGHRRGWVLAPSDEEAQRRVRRRNALADARFAASLLDLDELFVTPEIASNAWELHAADRGDPPDLFELLEGYERMLGVGTERYNISIPPRSDRLAVRRWLQLHPGALHCNDETP